MKHANAIDMAGPWVGEQEVELVMDALQNGWYGEKAYEYCHTFENEFAAYHNRKYALMTPNCTSAIHLLLAGLGIQDDMEVIVPECTWIASAAPISYQRASTVFADISAQHWCIDPKSIAQHITSKTKAIIAVNLYGNMADWDALQALADKHGLYLIEDAAESLGSIYKGVKSGKFGIGSVFSFHRTKTITTGEGGMLLLDDDALYERCKFLRDHGRQPGTYFNTEVTFKYMPFNLQAALGLAQFRRLDELVAKKRWIWKTYQSCLQDIPDIQLNPEPKDVTNGVWCSALVFGHSHNLNKDKVMQKLQQLGLPTRPFFYPLSSLPAFGSKAKAYQHIHPIAYDISNRGINLPSALNMTEEKIHQMAEGIKTILKVK